MSYQKNMACTNFLFRSSLLFCFQNIIFAGSSARLFFELTSIVQDGKTIQNLSLLLQTFDEK